MIFGYWDGDRLMYAARTRSGFMGNSTERMNRASDFALQLHLDQSACRSDVSTVQNRGVAFASSTHVHPSFLRFTSIYPKL
jgi:hypothetical protein